MTNEGQRSMEKRTFGAGGAQVPVIGIGTWRMEGDDRRAAIAAIRRSLDVGATHVDTAELYGSGHVEEIVGEAIAGRRDEVFLVSKVLPANASRQGTKVACERSLRRLGTDRLDCYLLHWPGSHPLADTLTSFAELEREGKIRSFGVSNFDEKDIATAVRLAGPGKIACNQVLYHLQERSIEHEVLSICEREQIAVVGYSPYGSGRFPSPKSDGGRVLEQLAARHRASAHQIALAFLTRRPSLFTIPKTAHEERAEENARAADVKLDAADITRLEAAFPLGRDHGGVPTL